MTETPCTVLTWNVNGMGSKVKRGIVSQYLRRHKPDFVLLQETHLQGTACKFIGRNPYTLLAHAGFTSDSRGIAILAKRNPPFNITRTWIDPQGTYVDVQGTWGRQATTTVSVYGPSPPLPPPPA